MTFNFSTASDSPTDPSDFFSGLGEDYQRYRPIYPASVIDTILSGLNYPDRLVAADIGAGTGIGSRLLAEQGVKVKAIEPNADMRRAAIACENVDLLAGNAEKIPLETASVDLVTSFQAFHWFDFNKSLQEFRRILKPEGRLALAWCFWNQKDPVSQEYTNLISQASKDPERRSQPPLQITALLKSLRYQLFWQGFWLPNFTNLQRCNFSFEQQLDLTGLVGLARSQGFVPTSGTALEKLVAELSDFQRKFSDTQGIVKLSYCNRLYLAERS